MTENVKAPLVRLDLGPYGPVKEFTSLAEFEAWLEAEKGGWEGRLQKMTENAVQTARIAPDLIRNSLARFEKQLRRAREQQAQNKQPEAVAIDALTAGLSSEIGAFGYRYVPSDSPEAVFASQLPTGTSASEASFRLAWFMRINWSAHSREPVREHALDYLRGTLAAELFQRGVLDQKVEGELAFTQIQREWEGRFNALFQGFDVNVKAARADLSKREAAEAAHDTLFQRTLSEEKAGFAAALEIARNSLKDLEDQFKRKIALHASVDYWRRRSFAALVAAFVQLTAGLIAGGTLVLYLIGVLHPFVGVERAPPWHDFLAPAVAFALSVWGLRILLRMFYANYSAHLDASERATMIESYLALTKETGLAKPEDLTALLGSIFRPGMSGLGADSSGPEPALAQIARMLMSKKP